MNHRTFSQRCVVVELCGLGLAIAFLLGGCGKPQGELFPPLDAPLVWPKPPEKPRIKYVGMVSTEKDLKRGLSWAQSFRELIFGKKEMGVLISPYAVAFDEDEKLLIADSAGGVIHIFDLASRKYAQFSTIGGEDRLNMPVALTLTESNIYVADSVLHKICVFDRAGNFEFSFGADVLKRPSGISYGNANEKIYVADTAGHAIYIFQKDGAPVRMIGSRGSGPGEFNFPTHLWAGKDGNLYVSDTLNYRVQVFSGDGEFLRTFGEQGDGPGYFAHPCGIVTDSLGHIYVIDRQFENIQIFDNEGRILMALGEEGGGLGEFWLPGGMYIDDDDRIYVADSFNKRVQIFELMEESSQ